MFFSIIIPVYNELCSLNELILRTITVLNSQTCKWELIVIDDGSKDKSASLLIDYESKINNFCFTELQHHYGQTIALRAGIEASKGDVIICMDGDLQHCPEELPTFIKYINEGYDLVSGYKDGKSKQGLDSSIAHLLIKFLFRVNLKYFGASIKAFRREILDTSFMVGNAHRYLGIYLGKNAKNIKEVPITIKKREKGQSKYKHSKMFSVIIEIISLKFFKNDITTLSKAFKVIGFFVAFTSFLLDIIVIVFDLIYKFNIKENFIAEFILINFLVIIGILLFSFGVLFELNSRTLNLPPYHVRKR